MSLNTVEQATLLKRVNTLGREMERLKRDVLRSWVTTPRKEKPKPTLFGSVQGGDITEDMIEEAKKNLFRALSDV